MKLIIVLRDLLCVSVDPGLFEFNIERGRERLGVKRQEGVQLNTRDVQVVQYSLLVLEIMHFCLSDINTVGR